MNNYIIYPGSFDPFTYGHRDLVNRALKVFDKVIIAVLKNPKKETLFSIEERINIIRSYFQNNEKIEIVSFNGLLVNFLEKKEIYIIMRGMRMLSDFDYEFQMSLTNRQLCDKFEAIYFVPALKYLFISSSMVKEIARFNGDLKRFVNEYTGRVLYEKFK